MASSPDPQASATDAANPFASLGAGMGFFQDWMKAAGSALPHLGAQAGAATPGASPWTLPTLDPEELDKRIQDLKTVQFWLEQNARMIGMTIQGMEVQRMTLSTLKGMNVSMDAVRDALKARAASSFVDPFAAAAAPAPAPAPAPAAPPPTPAAPPPTASAQPASHDEDAPAAEASELINPMRWWDTLTQQFTHLATTAAANVPAGLGAGSTPASKGRPRSTAGKTTATAKRPASKKAKPAAKSAPKRASTRPPRDT
jgi:hypothetical protein